MGGGNTMALELLTGLGGVNSKCQLGTNPLEPPEEFNSLGGFPNLINGIFILRLDIYTLFYILKYHKLIK